MIQIFKRSLACMLALSLAQVSPVSIAQSTLITTGEIAAGSSDEGFNKGHISSLLDLPEIQSALIKRGVSIEEARMRVAALTEEEARVLAERIDTLPAGAADVLGVLLVAFIVLLITDILGYTKVFSFTRPMK
jgi:hypothetical protein